MPDVDGVAVAAIERPGSSEQVAALLERARDTATPIVPCGGGTKLGWANPLDASNVVLLELGRLDRIELDADEGIATVGAGVSTEALSSAARECGKRVGLDALQPGASVGGTFAADPVLPEGDGPVLQRAYEVLGVEVALCDGSLARAGGRVVKNVTGFDLVRLYAGSFGTLAVVTELVLRLRPLAESRRVAALEAESLESAIAGAHGLRVGAVHPEGLAVVPNGGRPRTLCLLEGGERDVVRRLERTGGDAVDDEAWQGVRALAAGSGSTPCRVRLAARPSDALLIARAVEEHAGSSALALLLPAAGVVIADVDESAVERLFATASERGWSLRLERAPLELRRRVDAFGPPPATLALMRTLKRRFDPERVLSPGRFVGRI